MSLLMTRRFALFMATLCILGCHSFVYAARNDNLFEDVIVVTGKRIPSTNERVVTPDLEPDRYADAGGLVARLAGAGLVHNGDLSGQVAYRGLFGPRNRVQIDGQSFDSSGPNLMDPPLHFAPLMLVDHIEVGRGVSGVAEGPSLGTRVNARFKTTAWQNGSDFTAHYDVTTTWRSTNDSYGVGGVLGVANNRLRVSLLTSMEEGHNSRFADGEIPGGVFDRSTWGVSGGYRAAGRETGFVAWHQDTGDTGNAPFAMDIEYVDADFARLNHKFDAGRFEMEALLGFADIDHAMSNFLLRPAPASPAGFRRTLARARTLNGQFDAAVTLSKYRLRAGMDFERSERSVMITNPNNIGFQLGAFPGIDRDRFGLYGEWQGRIGDWDMNLGLRRDWHETSAATATVGSAVPMAVTMLADTFNAASRQRDDRTTDAVLKLWREHGSVVWRITLARKSRAPGLERFAWLPTPASGGLADGNIYVGDAGLEPEVASSVEAGIDWYGDRVVVRPTVYYRVVSDFIQGVPFDDTPGVIDSTVEMISAMNGDVSPMRFANTRAAFYGIDLDFEARLARQWQLSGVVSMVRGKRRDIDDDLYRISPPSLILGLTRSDGNWSVTLEGEGVARQDRVSNSNTELETGGYAVYRLYATWNVQDGVNFHAGVNNLFDRVYERHLAGYNRVDGGDVAVGERLPGPGRGVFLKLAAAM